MDHYKQEFNQSSKSLADFIAQKLPMINRQNKDDALVLFLTGISHSDIQFH